MIYNIQTYKTYGYWPEDLGPSSNKLILAACNKCGKVRITTKPHYHDLCNTCANRISTTKRFEDPLEREKLSEAMKKVYSKMDDPGEQIVGHHIAYDFGRPEAFVVQITKRFHGLIHHPKGCNFNERGYSLID